MATPTATEINNALLIPNAIWSGGAVTYSIPGAGALWPGYGPGEEAADPRYSVLSSDQAAQFRSAVARWDAVLALRMTETDDAATAGQIRVAFTDADKLSDEDVSGYAYEPPAAGGSAVPINGDIWLDYKDAGAPVFPGSGMYLAMLHELGHALGLKHPFEEGATLPAAFDNLRYSVMSYTLAPDSTYRLVEETSNGPKLSAYSLVPATPMVFDIAALQARYGVDTATEARDSSYSHSGSGPLLATIYDAGGEDGVDMEGGARGSLIDLTPGAYSSLNYWSAADQAAYWTAKYPALAAEIAAAFADPDTYTWSNNLGIAYSTVIEYARGGAFNDTITGNDVSNGLLGGGGADRVSAGLGGDTVAGEAGDDYLRGDAGNDLMNGGDGFDDVNGNMGDDSITGGLGPDWVAGGKDNDILFGEEDSDVVYGNLGADICDGGVGDDVIRGGQDNDTVYGRDGNDWLSGDRGEDTVVGGAGADIFHTFNEAGVDRVTDFNRAEGDRVLVDPGTAYTVSQSGGDVIVDMGGGNRMILVGVQMSSLSGDWIFGA